MDSRLIFLPSARRLDAVDDGTPQPQPTTRLEGSRKGEADLLLKCRAGEPRKAFVDDVRIRTKTDTGRRGENPKALGRTLVKELGKLTP